MFLLFSSPSFVFLVPWGLPKLQPAAVGPRGRQPVSGWPGRSVLDVSSPSSITSSAPRSLPCSGRAARGSSAPGRSPCRTRRPPPPACRQQPVSQTTRPLIISCSDCRCVRRSYPCCGPPSLTTPSRASCLFRCILKPALILRNNICTGEHICLRLRHIHTADKLDSQTFSGNRSQINKPRASRGHRLLLRAAREGFRLK